MVGSDPWGRRDRNLGTLQGVASGTVQFTSGAYWDPHEELWAPSGWGFTIVAYNDDWFRALRVGGSGSPRGV